VIQVMGPIMTGLIVSGRVGAGIGAELASMKVIMVTTETEMSQMASALEAVANEYIMKPFTKDILVEKLELMGITALVAK